jgi:small GTP-binding protein
MTEGKFTPGRMKRIRVVICGEASVGKSSIIKRFATGTFSETNCATIAGAFHSSYVRRNGEIIALEIWDTAGSERYHSVIPSFFKNAAAVVIVFDLTLRASFDSVNYWRDFASQNAPESTRLLLVGNKSDLFANRTVLIEEGKALVGAGSFAAYAETSARTGESIDNLFSMLSDVPPNGVVQPEVRGEVISLDKEQCC